MHSEDERYHGLGMDPLVIMDALVVVRTQKTSVIMVSAWIPWLSDALGTRTLLWFGMDALVIGCTRNANVIMVWAWMLW